MNVSTEYVDVKGPAGSIRALVCAPKASAPVQKRSGVVLYSDIFQLTPPMVRTTQRLAGHGFVVVAPELYGRFEKGGTVLDFDKDRQRALDDSDKVTVQALDEDRRAVIDWLAARADVDASRVCAAGWCFGGHLAFRAAMEPDVKATACFYGTGIHNGKCGAPPAVDSLARAAVHGAIKGRLLLVWGRNDPHIPAEGRALIHRTLDDAGVRFEARLFDAEHAFMRDEGPRYDPEATDKAFAAMVDLFREA
jgi:carboxymethylenebutenolidase